MRWAARSTPQPWAAWRSLTDGGAHLHQQGRPRVSYNSVKGVFANSTVYAATAGGLSISTDGGLAFNNRTTANGLGSNDVNGVAANGSAVYVATTAGLSISTDGGATFSNRTTANGLGSNLVLAAAVSGNAVYAGTQSGLSISTNGGATFVNKLGNSGSTNNDVGGVSATGSAVYAATRRGLYASTDGGATFTRRTTANGLGSNDVRGASSPTIASMRPPMAVGWLAGNAAPATPTPTVTPNAHSYADRRPALSPLWLTPASQPPLTYNDLRDADLVEGFPATGDANFHADHARGRL
ncbi:hypothetical protein [Candidatus Amarolinea dominans]|uniref:WD40/YVTN/BNR-like repeat-containing protein n=1 Tax=Candidatus Amarolinea dominans TaxID=3140696 RepID=UPI0031349075|nr:hypothetical protein [Anaerolineae bacterium]